MHFNFLYCLYWFLAFLTVAIFSLKILFAKKYFEKKCIREEYKINEKEYTVVQPVLSGDPRLEEDLEENLKNLSEMKFIWLIDKKDAKAREISYRILKNELYKKRVEIFEIEDVPQEINPKVFKINRIMNKIDTEYTIILDDDSIIDTERINEFCMYKNMNKEYIVTGIPYNYGIEGIWSRLVSAFVNSNSILTYFTMSHIENNKTINGMFYMCRTEILKKYNVFEEIRYELCDDLAVARFLLSKNVVLIQSAVFCNTRTTVSTFRQYMALMKRWLLFTKIYMKRAMTFKFFLFVLLPSVLPPLLLILGSFLGWEYIFLTTGLLLLKALFLYKLRFSIVKKKESAEVIFFEVLNDFIILFIYIYTLITPPVIKWRNKKIKVTDGKIRYE